MTTPKEKARINVTHHTQLTASYILLGKIKECIQNVEKLEPSAGTNTELQSINEQLQSIYCQLTGTD